jgi:hypothetical protein
MKLFAQVGHGLGDKVAIGLKEKLIDGAIFSPKDLKRETMVSRISEIRRDFPDAEIMVDPQFYVCLFANSPAINFGNITDWSYFRTFRKGELERSQTVDRVLEEYFKEIADLEVTSVLAPNIYISQSFDSREAVIAKNFVRQAREVYNKTGNKRPLLASLIICREALQDRKEFEDFINDITILDPRPDGFYLIIASRSAEALSDIYHTDVVANWMMFNLSLSINGFEVINGYSDLLTPFLGAAGGVAGATGWWSNLRVFSIDRFFPSVGGRLPIVRYLSKLLLNRITFSEKEALIPFVPRVLNQLPHDQDYDREHSPEHSPEPERSREVLQSWEALKSLNEELSDNDVATGLEKCLQAISRAGQAYSEIATFGIVLDQKSRDEHVLPLLDGLRQFRERAEL